MIYSLREGSGHLQSCRPSQRFHASLTFTTYGFVTFHLFPSLELHVPLFILVSFSPTQGSVFLRKMGQVFKEFFRYSGELDSWIFYRKIILHEETSNQALKARGCSPHGKVELCTVYGIHNNFFSNNLKITYNYLRRNVFPGARKMLSHPRENKRPFLCAFPFLHTFDIDSEYSAW